MSLDGSQLMAVGMRYDCISETSVSFAVRSLMRANATASAEDRSVAIGLLNYAMIQGGYSQPWVPGGRPDLIEQRPWTLSGDAFGLMPMEQTDAAFKLFYKDGNARGLLGGIATAGLLGTCGHAMCVCLCVCVCVCVCVCACGSRSTCPDRK
jgi:hypothetical protein